MRLIRKLIRFVDPLACTVGFLIVDVNRWSQVSLDYYRRESAKIAQLFKDCLPDVEIGELEDAIFGFFTILR
jgi:hypothetical protein